MVPGQPKMSESSRGKWWLKWRNPNSRNSKKLSKWQTTSIDVCLMHLHICIPVLCSGITFVALWFSWRVLMKVPIGVQPHNVSFKTWEMDIEKSLPWHDAECAIWGCQIEVRFQCNSTNVFFFYCWEDEIADVWYTQTWWRLHTLLDSKYRVAARADSYLYCFSSCIP